MPTWVGGDIDTSDLVQDALQRTFARLPFFESKHAGALRASSSTVENRIRDRLRRATRRLEAIMPDASVRLSEAAAPQHQQLIDDETWRLYLDGLGRLTDRDRRLIVGRAELGYSYRQLAFVERLSSAEAARKALGRALRKLIDVMLATDNRRFFTGRGLGRPPWAYTLGSRALRSRAAATLTRAAAPPGRRRWRVATRAGSAL